MFGYGRGFGKYAGKYCTGYMPLLLTVAVVGVGYMAYKASQKQNAHQTLPAPAATPTCEKA
ncbi:MAG: hypothetical protein OCC45_04605 [Desulfotalea sp.]